KTKKQIPADEKSINAQLLIKAGFVDKLMAGVYTYLPLGWRVYQKIENIIREEMDAIGGQEILMPTLTPKENWQQTNRWDNFDALFKFEGVDKKEYALGATHEEVISPLVKKFVSSYKDLPLYIYQIQNKFRNEVRAKSGMLRGREFIMKDLYSFHTDQKDLDKYYEKAKAAYTKIFERCGIGKTTYITLATGGSFSKFSHEFQTITEHGEDTIYLCKNCKEAINKEIIKDLGECQTCSNKDLEEHKAIEVGNIFNLGDKFSTPFKLTYVDKDDKEQPVIMGCYGIGLGRVLGTVVEVFNDDKGIIWPESVAPFSAHLLAIGESAEVKKQAKAVYDKLIKEGVEVLFDDRLDVSAGEKFANADLIGIPNRLVVSEKTGKKVEVKKRDGKEEKLMEEKEVLKMLK
ncbi:prolyl-tRNA synthetase, partial [Patescibacteria group bacterium]|nr:prolyl-tRNA synthetase [Patescibacteria group bacterium]